MIIYLFIILIALRVTVSFSAQQLKVPDHDSTSSWSHVIPYADSMVLQAPAHCHPIRIINKWPQSVEGHDQPWNTVNTLYETWLWFKIQILLLMPKVPRGQTSCARCPTRWWVGLMLMIWFADILLCTEIQGRGCIDYEQNPHLREVNVVRLQKSHACYHRPNADDFPTPHSRWSPKANTAIARI